ncbi:MAG: IMP cyclohydrolase [Oscillibacter sp.]|nr:IMP cyclohydrolase [Oscillibacter sp.]
MNAQTLPALLAANPYPGRGIVLGRSADNKASIAVYFIMGRSENSRNRVFSTTNDGIRTKAFDPSKMKDPSLIIYHPVRLLDGNLIVTNGDQTDTVWEALKQGTSFQAALAERSFEQDPPHYTPRISGLLSKDGKFQLSILKSADGRPECCCRYFYSYQTPPAGEGRFLHTYAGDGEVLPSFEGEPVRVKLEAPNAQTLADGVWDALNHDNRVSLFVRYTNLSDGKYQDAIINKNR